MSVGDRVDERVEVEGRKVWILRLDEHDVRCVVPEKQDTDNINNIPVLPEKRCSNKTSTIRIGYSCIIPHMYGNLLGSLRIC